MTDHKITPDASVLVAIDISKRRHEMPSTSFRDMRLLAMQTWREIAQVVVE